MSYDLILFDPAKLKDFPASGEEVPDWIARHVAAHPKEERKATRAIRNVLKGLVDTYGDIHAAGAPWAMWPPAILAKGRHCTINLTPGGDPSNMTISLAGRATKAGLVLLDPQGRKSLITSPTGGGVFD